MRLLKWVVVWMLALGILLAVGNAMATSSGSWGQINQEIEKPEGWTRFVQNSGFAFGKREQIGEIGGKPLYALAYGTYPSIDGSTVAVPMAMEFARQHLDLPEGDLDAFVYFSTTHSAYEHLILKQPNGSASVSSMNAMMEENHPVDLMIGTEPSAEELALAEAHGVTLIKEPICYDAFIFITHVDNPVDSLTVEQIQKIYSGQIINWLEVGGPNMPIFAYQREANSGSQTAMENLVMRGIPMDGAERIEMVYEMGSLIDRIGIYDNKAVSLGYTYQYYIDVLYKNDSIKTLKINDIAPTPENLRSGAYPFTACYYGVIRQEDEQGVAGQFLNWMASPEGQRVIAQAGYVPMDEVE